VTAVLPMILVVAHVGYAGLAAHPVPRFEITPACRTDLGSRQACRRDEEAARTQLHRQWRRFSRAERTSCERLARIGGAPGYVELLTCLRIAQDASALPASDRLGGGIGR
jgi:hypothetical protein